MLAVWMATLNSVISIYHYTNILYEKSSHEV